MKKINIIIFCFLILFINYVQADIEEEIYSPDFDNKVQSDETINFDNEYKKVDFKKLITCVFKKDEYKRIFRFGITTENRFFYRQPINLNNNTDGYAGEKIFLNMINENYNLQISKKQEKLELFIDFEKKRSNLKRNNQLIDKVNCK